MEITNIFDFVCSYLTRKLLERLNLKKIKYVRHKLVPNIRNLRALFLKRKKRLYITQFNNKHNPLRQLKELVFISNFTDKKHITQTKIGQKILREVMFFSKKTRWIIVMCIPRYLVLEVLQRKVEIEELALKKKPYRAKDYVTLLCILFFTFY